MIDKLLSKKLKTLSKARKLRQIDLAARLGMDYQSVNRALNGCRPIYARELPRFAAALGVPLEKLLETEEEE